ncbi:MAG: HEAT repeat domain-containing protein, partial [Thermodesulfovibrionales bacterium]
MTVTKQTEISVPASCANLFKNAPRSSDEFDIVSSPEAEDLRKIMTVIGKKNPGEVVTQVATWIVTDDVSFDELNSRYVRRPAFQPFGGEPAASVEDVIRAMKIVEDAGIDITKKNIYKEKIAAIRGLGSSEKEIQTISMRFLGIEGIKKDRVEILIPFLKDESSGVRKAAAKALGEIKDPRAVEPLISAL